MTVIARPQHPFRLAGVFVASIAAFALIAAAVGAVLYIIDNERGSAAESGPTATVDLPPGMVLVQQIEGAQQWRDALGFSPILPDTLPEGTAPDPEYLLQQPDDRGRQAGHLRFSPDGGPLIVLVQQQGQIAEPSALRSQESSQTRAYFETFACGNVVMQVQLYFGLDVTNPPPPSASAAVAEDFTAALKDQCDA